MRSQGPPRGPCAVPTAGLQGWVRAASLTSPRLPLAQGAGCQSLHGEGQKMPETLVCIPAACSTTGRQLNLSSGGLEHHPCALRGSEEKVPTSHTTGTSKAIVVTTVFLPNGASLAAQIIKNLPAVQETRVPS